MRNLLSKDRKTEEFAKANTTKNSRNKMDNMIH